MGITSSTEPNSRYHLFTLEKLHQLKEEKLEDMPEKRELEYKQYPKLLKTCGGTGSTPYSPPRENCQ
ncbi:hypothetical protein HID58_021673 [Brassica napus]|uniref:Uncharacterized protein n=3 Tax=Brassica TaxID=3705 RepID=A0ABQ8CZ90_BRANA|nr:hypothetical protein HID58_021673 [Brassica napus]CDY35095.1 BnaA06g11050D [Brassica napus]